MEAYRGLAEARPDAFLPDLARSLGVLGAVLREEAPAEAAAAFREGLAAVAPLTEVHPRALGPLAPFLLRGYVQAAEAGGVEVDAALVARLSGALGVDLGGGGSG